MKEGEERESSATPDTPTNPSEDAALAVALAWTEGTGLPRVPARQNEMQRQAVELLAEGHDALHLAAVARWMAAKGWKDLGYALTANGAPRMASLSPKPKPGPTCAIHPYGSLDSNGRCLTCNAEAAGIKPTALAAAPAAPTNHCEQHGPHTTEKCPHCLFQDGLKAMRSRTKAGV